MYTVYVFVIHIVNLDIKQDSFFKIGVGSHKRIFFLPALTKTNFKKSIIGIHELMYQRNSGFCLNHEN